MNRESLPVAPNPNREFRTDLESILGFTTLERAELEDVLKKHFGPKAVYLNKVCASTQAGLVTGNYKIPSGDEMPDNLREHHPAGEIIWRGVDSIEMGQQLILILMMLKNKNLAGFRAGGIENVKLGTAGELRPGDEVDLNGQISSIKQRGQILFVTAEVRIGKKGWRKEQETRKKYNPTTITLTGVGMLS